MTKENVCPECGGPIIRNYRGELVCKRCGLVVSEKVFDYGPEMRTYDAEQREKRGRTGPPMTLTLHDKGLSTLIDQRNRDYHGKNLTPARRVQMYRLRKWQRSIRISSGAERNLAFALSEIQRMSSQLGIPRNVQETAALIYRKVLESKLGRRRSIEDVVAAVLYLACRQHGIPRTLNEIAEVSRVGKREIGRSYRVITRELSIRSSPINPVDYVSRFASELSLSEKVQARAISIIKKFERKKRTSGQEPQGTAAAAIYIAGVLCGEQRTERQVADAAQITEVTIRGRVHRICAELQIELPETKLLEKKEKSKKQQQLRKKPIVRIQNLVLSAAYPGTELDLKHLARALGRTARYKPNKFSGLIYRTKQKQGEKPIATFVVFDSGKMNCVGATSLKNAKRAIAELTLKMKKAGFKVPKPRVKVQNLVASVDFGAEIDIEELVRTHEDIEYEPGIFPAAVYKLDNPKATVLLFSSGSGVCVGAKNIKSVRSAVEKVARDLRRSQSRQNITLRTDES